MWLLGFKEVMRQGFGTLRPYFGGTLDVEGDICSPQARNMKDGHQTISSLVWNIHITI